MPGMRPSLIVNRTPEKSIAAYVESGYKRETIFISDDPAKLADRHRREPPGHLNHARNRRLHPHARRRHRSHRRG